MTDLNAWCAEHGIKPSRIGAAEWLNQHPDLVEQIAQGRTESRWTWPTISRWLHDMHGWPFSPRALADECRRRGIR